MWFPKYIYYSHAFGYLKKTQDCGYVNIVTATMFDVIYDMGRCINAVKSCLSQMVDI